MPNTKDNLDKQTIKHVIEVVEGKLEEIPHLNFRKKKGLEGAENYGKIQALTNLKQELEGMIEQ